MKYIYFTFIYIIVSLNFIGTLIFSRFLPKDKIQCQDWSRLGEKMQGRNFRGYISIAISFIIVFYGISNSILLLDKNTRCLQLVGGSGCSNNSV
jgi:hypothetical protein